MLFLVSFGDFCKVTLRRSRKHRQAWVFLALQENLVHFGGHAVEAVCLLVFCFAFFEVTVRTCRKDQQARGFSRRGKLCLFLGGMLFA